DRCAKPQRPSRAPTSTPCAPDEHHRSGQPTARWHRSTTPDRGVASEWRPAAVRRWRPGSSRRRWPQCGRSRAILASLEVPPEPVTTTTETTVIAPAQEALLVECAQQCGRHGDEEVVVT